MQAADRARQVANVLTPFLAAAASSRHLARARRRKSKKSTSSLQSRLQAAADEACRHVTVPTASLKGGGAFIDKQEKEREQYCPHIQP
jgi:hypothetical protein